MVTTQFSAHSADAVEAERLRALERYAILDTPADDVFDRDRIWFKAVHGVQGICRSTVPPGCHR